jgi:hypothetical protein
MIQTMKGALVVCRLLRFSLAGSKRRKSRKPAPPCCVNRLVPTNPYFPIDAGFDCRVGQVELFAKSLTPLPPWFHPAGRRIAMLAMEE